MRLVLRDNGEAICALDDDSKMLGYYSIVNGAEIHVIDNNPYSISVGGQLEDVSLVEKYIMPEEVYDKRPGTLREYRRQQVAKDPNFKFFPAKGAGKGKKGPKDAPPGAEESKHCVVGSRCQVTPGGRRGVVKFVGVVKGLAEGYFVRFVVTAPLIPL